MLLVILTYSHKYIRDLGLRMIITYKSKPNKYVRSFNIPLVNFHASEYTDLINWNLCKLMVLTDLSAENSKYRRRTWFLDFLCLT